MPEQGDKLTDQQLEELEGVARKGIGVDPFYDDVLALIAEVRELRPLAATIRQINATAERVGE